MTAAATKTNDPTTAVIEWFPMLEGIKFTHTWGGPVGMPRDWTRGGFRSRDPYRVRRRLQGPRCLDHQPRRQSAGWLDRRQAQCTRDPAACPETIPRLGARTTVFGRSAVDAGHISANRPGRENRTTKSEGRVHRRIPRKALISLAHLFP